MQQEGVLATTLRVLGVPVRIHITVWALVLAWVGAIVARDGLAGLPFALGVLGLSGGSILAHELGHALSAHALGIRTQEIVLYPFGGAARMELRWVSAYEDVLVSLGGPGASLLLGGVCAAIGAVTGLEGAWLVGVLNIGLGLFNLIPAFPLDGGRVLRAVLVTLWGPRLGTIAALGAGVAFTAAFVVVGALARQPSLAMVAVFTAALQAREVAVLQRRGGLRQVPRG